MPIPFKVKNMRNVKKIICFVLEQRDLSVNTSIKYYMFLRGR